MLTAELKVVGGRHHGRIIPLNNSKFLVGREQDCHLRPNSEMVSRHHCVFVLDDYTLRLRDLGSTNGTFVNNQRVRGIVTLKPGDLVRIGKLDLEVLISEPMTDDSTSSPAESDTVKLSSGDTTLLPGLLDAAEPYEGNSGDTTVFIPAMGSSDTHPGGETASSELDTGESSADESASVESDTSTPEMPQQPEVPQEAAHGTGEIPAFNPTLGGPGMPPQGYPPQQPQMPGYPPQQYPPMNYPYGYQGGMPQYPQPGFPPMQGGYPGFNGYPPPPQPGYDQYPVQQAPPQMAVPESDTEIPTEPHAPSKVGGSRVEAPPVNLPDPSTTGARDEPVKAETSDSDSEKEKQDKPANVSNAVDGILKQMTQRTPGG